MVTFYARLDARQIAIQIGNKTSPHCNNASDCKTLKLNDEAKHGREASKDNLVITRHQHTSK